MTQALDADIADTDTDDGEVWSDTWPSTLYEAEAHADPFGDGEARAALHWRRGPAITASAPLAAGSLLGAFALGALTAVGLLALTGRLDD